MSETASGAGFAFLGGCPRSGLTLMRRLLTGHSRIHCGADTGLPVAIAMQWENFTTQLGDLHRQDFGLEAEQVRINMAELLTGLIGAPAEADPDLVVVEKTSLNILAFERLGRLLPQARFVHIVRDGRDVAASLLQRDWRGPDGQRFAHVSDPAAALKYWSDLTGIGLQAEAALGPRRVLRLRYEDIVKKPKRSMTALLRFLGLEYEVATLNYTGRPIELVGVGRDSLPLLDAPLTTARIGGGRALGELADEVVQERLRALGYAAAAAPARARR
ncbi:sulfotransferase [uncultured Maricaulis sp.]|uniref:sulfotransferase family protein n=1 Tax=uncultured Maricaulis sp. TaxID=174710 RepID=UPI0030DB722A|tara:strand:- start:158537 stop:159358 length:822 start_codon:yes stop_codon:yes gene_type:complete